MSRGNRRKGIRPADPREVSWRTGMQILDGHPLFRGGSAVARLDVPALALSKGFAHVDSLGHVTCHKGAHLDADEWAWVVAHLVLHRGLGHLAEDRRHDSAAGATACLEVNRFLRESPVGREPIQIPAELPRGNIAELAEQWRQDGVPPEFQHCGTGGFGPDIVVVDAPSAHRTDWPSAFAAGIARAAADAVDAAGGRSGSGPGRRTVWELARRWFVSSYPLLGGLASHFTIVADADLARTWHISVAAVNAAAGEIYVNPLLRLTEAEWRFVLAHEMLHAVLHHGERVGWRDPYLWNVAADYVINGWLVEMGVGELPDGVLFDQSLTGQSAEGVYDLIAIDLRRLRKLATLRGQGLGDVLGEPLPHSGSRSSTDLDEYYRRALTTGLAYYERAERGLLPAGLVEEIRALDHPPLPWDARLARWFAEHVRSPEPRRSYARASRRQSATPHIPRPGWLRPEELRRQCTFGVVIDTSGSMDSRLLGQALGAIASYATARDVPKARVVFCDAAAYDAGYLDVEEVAGRVRVRGRGGTVLQPGIWLLERADDFPADAPILIITDADCDALRVRREHAYLVPPGARLPFTPRGPVFRMAPPKG